MNTWSFPAILQVRATPNLITRQGSTSQARLKSVNLNQALRNVGQLQIPPPPPHRPRVSLFQIGAGNNIQPCALIAVKEVKIYLSMICLFGSRIYLLRDCDVVSPVRGDL